MADETTHRARPQRPQGPRGHRRVRRRWTRPPSSPSSTACATPATTRRCSAPSKLYVHDEANDLNVGDRVRVQETRPLSKLKRWRLVEVLERATMIQQEIPPAGRRQQRRQGGAVHQGARRLQAALRVDRRHLRRHRQGRHPRRRGEEGRRRQVRRRPHEEGEAPSRRQLHPLRRERRRAHQRPAAARAAPASSARSAASCATRSSCASSRWHRRCCDGWTEDQEGRPRASCSPARTAARRATVMRVLPDEGKVIVDGVNIAKKHQKADAAPRCRAASSTRTCRSPVANVAIVVPDVTASRPGSATASTPTARRSASASKCGR